MSSEWRTYRLHDVGRIVTGKTPKSGVSEYEGCDVPFISPPDFSGVKWIEQTARCISEAGAQTVKGSVIPPRSVLVTCIGSDMGKAALSTLRCVTNQQINAILVDETKFCPEFVYYNLSLRKNEIRGLAGGSAQPILNKSAFGQIEFDAPSLEEQKHISTTLRPLNDRITLLRETNATLEAIAQALFKSWFVDFDPVRAKMEGRTPEGMDEATAALFPDGFETSELGEVPRGWRTAKVAEVAEVVKGKSYSSKDLVDNHHTALVTLKSFERGGGFRMDGFKPYSGAYKPSQVVSAGDLIVAYTDVTQAAELIGKPAVVVGVDEYATLVASLDVGIVRPDERRCGKQFLYGLFRTDAFQAHTLAHTSGTTVLHLAKDGIGSFAFALPPNGLIRSFEVIAAAIASRKQTNSDAVRTLSTLRDTLLPRLISGQLRLPNAEMEATTA